MTTPTPAQLPGAGLRHLDAAIQRADTDPPGTDLPSVTGILEILHDAATGLPADETPEPRAFPVPQPPPVQPQRPLTREQYIRRLCLQLAIQYFTGLAESDEDDLFQAAKAWASWIQHG